MRDFKIHSSGGNTPAISNEETFLQGYMHKMSRECQNAPNTSVFPNKFQAIPEQFPDLKV